MSVRKIFLTFVVTLVAVFAVVAQERGAPKSELLTPTATPAADEVAGVPDGGVPEYVFPETPEQRAERLGTAEDPGINPDAERVWIRFGKKYKIRRYDRQFAKYFPENPKLVRPVGFVNFTYEIYQQNEKWVWVWMAELEPRKPRPEKAPKGTKTLPPETVDYLNMIREDFTPLDPPQSPVSVRFEESSEGLPGSGSWRNTPAVADMNGDGLADLILPPQRAGNGIPVIFLGDGKGGWTQWETDWPSRLNYGAVVAADFNKDKKMDLAFGVHLSGVAVFHGDGKGGFKEVFYEKAFPSRRLAATDIDRDGWTDLVVVTEGPMGRTADPTAKEYTSVRGYLNRSKGTKWEGFNIAHKDDNSSGDWLAVGTFNNDKYPDFLTSTVYFNGTSTVHLSQGAVKKYDYFWDGKGYVIPFRSYYYGVAAGRFSAKDRDDAILSTFRIWPSEVNQDVLRDPPLKRVVGVDRITFSPDGKQAERKSIMRWPAGRLVPGIAPGDFDGDGKNDLMFTRHDPRETVLLLGDGKGGFARARVDGIDLRPLSNYDITVADVNQDSRPDVILLYESESATSLSARNGSVHVFLNRGPVESAASR